MATRAGPTVEFVTACRTELQSAAADEGRQLSRLCFEALLRQRGLTPPAVLAPERTSRRLRRLVWEFRGSLTPDALDELPLLGIDARATGSYYTCPDVADYIARAVLLPLLFDDLDEHITANDDLEAIVLPRCREERDRVLPRLETLTVLDPTCGTGAFLLAALRLLCKVRRACLGHSEGEAQALARLLHGLDLEPAAAEVCRMRLALELARGGVADWDAPFAVRAGDVLAPDLDGRSFDAVLGNPPYLRYRPSAASGFETTACGDLSALVVEQTYRLTRPGARLGLLLPISHFVTAGFAPLQRLTWRMLDRLWVAFFANRPAQLFAGAQKRLALLLGRRGAEPPVVHTTGYLRWRREERPRLLDRLRYTPTSGFRVLPTSLEKIGSRLESALLDRLMARRRLAEGVVRSSPHVLTYTRKFGYFFAFLDFVPLLRDRRTGQEQQPSEMKTLHLPSQEALLATVAALSSSTFFWFWNVISDGRNLNRRDLLAFPFDPEEVPPTLRGRLAELGHCYLARLRTTSRLMRKGHLEIETFDYVAQKPLLDEIDRTLAGWYGLGDEELSWLLNYDLPYRVPQTSL